MFPWKMPDNLPIPEQFLKREKVVEKPAKSPSITDQLISENRSITMPEIKQQRSDEQLDANPANGDNAVKRKISVGNVNKAKDKKMKVCIIYLS